MRTPEQCINYYWTLQNLLKNNFLDLKDRMVLQHFSSQLKEQVTQFQPKQPNRASHLNAVINADNVIARCEQWVSQRHDLSRMVQGTFQKGL
ncbi:MAG TPA: hypothetical protein VHD33_08345, partial [Legionellaceae bacterium]|nr:hypothetical protein [Legionellaceae bacterium]